MTRERIALCPTSEMAFNAGRALVERLRVVRKLGEAP